MDFDIGDIIRRLTGGQDPNAAVMGARAEMPAEPASRALPPVPETSTPTGAITPVTNPQPAKAAPTVTQSPPDLANMYIKLMEKNQNAQRLDSGLSLIAAGLSNSPTNRAALISASGHGGGAGGMSLSAQDMINFEKQRESAQNAIIRKQALPALMKQYNLSPAHIQALEAGGKLDEVLTNFATRSLAHITDAETGQVHLVDDRASGKPRVIATIGGEKSDPTQWVDGPNGPELRNSRTGALVGDKGVGLKTELEFRDTPEGGLTAINKRTGETVATKIGGAPTPETEKFERPDGSQFLRNKRDGKIEEIAPARKIGDAIPALTEELHQVNADRALRGLDPMTHEELIKLKQQPGVNVNVAADGTVLPAPEKGYDYERGPDRKPLIGPDGKPKLYKIPGGGPEEESTLAATKLAEEKSEKAKKEATAKANQAFAASNVSNAIDNAFKYVDKIGASGVGSKLARGVPIGGMSWDSLDAAVNSINSNVAFEQLRKMREAAATGASGLGQVTEKENQMLSSVIADLRAYQDTDQLKRGLARTKAAMELLATNDYKTQADFDIALAKRTEEIQSDYHNKSGRSKYKVTPVPR